MSKPSIVVAVLLAGLGFAVPSASARIGLDSFDSGPVGTDAGLAAAHADVQVKFAITTVPKGGDFNGPKPAETLRDVRVDLPTGLAGSAVAAPKCSDHDLSAHRCTADAQVGVLGIYGGDPAVTGSNDSPVYNMTPAPGEVAKLGIDLLGVATSVIHVSVRDGSDFGLHAELDALPTEAIPPIFAARLDLWGVPADPSHDSERFAPAANGGSAPPAVSSAPPRPFLTNPSTCDSTPLVSTISIDSYQSPGDFYTQSTTTPTMKGCDGLIFSPTLSARADVTRAASPSGYAVRLRVPQNPNASGAATPDVKDVSVTLPLGTSLSPSAADGLDSCTNEQAGFGTSQEGACPAASRIGSVRITTPLLADPLEGSAYIGRPLPGNTFRLFLVAKTDGVVVHLEGRIAPDPSTGQLTTTFTANPQIPFSALDLELQGGPRAPLVNPATCGPASTKWTISSYSGQTVSGEDRFDVDSGPDGGPCPAAAPFVPSFSAGTTSATAGQSAPFTLTFGRNDGEQTLGALSVDLPAGLLGRVNTVPLCPEAQAVNGGCGEQSRIGTVITAAGPGATPLHLPGKAYLTGPYKGGPYGLEFTVPAVAGPYDLGTVVVRAAIFVDPNTAALRVVSDPLPQILDGVPLQIRTVNVTLDRPGFMVNPTNCTPSSIAATVTSAAGASIATGSPFHVDGCGSLPYEPELKLGLSGKGQTTDGKHPALSATLTPRPTDANTRTVKVTLPLSLALDPDNAQALCEPAAAAADACPAASIVGRASARSILPDELTAPVYFVRGERTDPKSGRKIKTLPTLYLPLRADGVTIFVRGSSSVVDEHLVTTFDGLPDVPLSSFRLDLDGGDHGILVVSRRNVCASTQVAQASFTGQNARPAAADVTMDTPCTLGVVQTSHTSRALSVTVGGIGPGRVVVSGTGIAKASRTISASTSATLKPKLSKATRARLSARHDVGVRLSVAFTPRGQTKAQTVVKKVVLHASKR